MPTNRISPTRPGDPEHAPAHTIPGRVDHNALVRAAREANRRRLADIIQDAADAAGARDYDAMADADVSLDGMTADVGLTDGGRVTVTLHRSGLVEVSHQGPSGYQYAKASFRGPRADQQATALVSDVLTADIVSQETCVADVGWNSECGDEAGERGIDGDALCHQHAAAERALFRLANHAGCEVCGAAPGAEHTEDECFK
jgi:hypothetical protein